MESQELSRGPRSRDDVLGFSLFLLDVVATCVTPFLRIGFGTDALGVGIWSLVFMIAMGTVTPFILVHIAAWFAALVVQRLVTLWRWNRGHRGHSRDKGYPWLAMRVPFVESEETAMGLIEPMIVFVAGVLIASAYSESLGGFEMFAALCLFVRQAVERDLWARRLQQIRDAEIEQRWMHERYRQNRW